MTPARRAAFEAALDALEKLYDDCTNFDGWEEYQEALSAARARVLALYAERLTAGEEVVRVVNPEYPGDKHYWAANNVPTFPVSYVITPGTFRVTRVEEGE